MNDLIERLRGESWLCEEAADEIERLTAQNERLMNRGIEDMRFEIANLSARNELLEKALNKIANSGLSGTYAIGVAVNAIAACDETKESPN